MLDALRNGLIWLALLAGGTAALYLAALACYVIGDILSRLAWRLWVWLSRSDKPPWQA